MFLLWKLTAPKSLSLVDVLVQSKLSPSKRQAREDIQNGACLH